MQNILISRYPDPKATGWAGYIQPEDHSWIAFIGLDGKPLFFLHRHPVTGAVLPDDPVERGAHLKAIDAEVRALHTGVQLTAEEAALHGVVQSPGEVVVPLGVSGNGDADVSPPRK